MSEYNAASLRSLADDLQAALDHFAEAIDTTIESAQFDFPMRIADRVTLLCRQGEQMVAQYLHELSAAELADQLEKRLVDLQASTAQHGDVSEAELEDLRAAIAVHGGQRAWLHRLDYLRRAVQEIVEIDEQIVVFREQIHTTGQAASALRDQAEKLRRDANAPDLIEELRRSEALLQTRADILALASDIHDLRANLQPMISQNVD